ncbi:MAG: hypothetical protein HND57_06610 [Planctomycetes bacterium]|nr:hypothetical protein [Planctomycetota bacterium]
MSRRSLICCAVISGVIAAQSHGQVRYSATDLGTLQGGTANSWGWDLNECGQVIGYGDAPNNRSLHAFLWSEGEMTDLKTLGGTYSWAYGINNRTQITGYSIVDSVTIRGFFWEDGTMEDIGWLPGSRGTFSRGNAINQGGLIVGVCHGTGDGWIVPYAGFIYDDGAWTEIPTFGGDESQAYGINNAGIAVGWARFAEPEPTAPRAFAYANGQLIDIGTFGGTLSKAASINNLNQVVGVATDGIGSDRAFVWEAGVLTDIGDLGGGVSAANDINDRGQIVGYSDSAEGIKTGFLWQDGVMWDVNDLVEPGSNVVFHGARAINELGQIACSGTFEDGTKHAYLLSPVDMMTLDRPAPGQSGVVNTFTVNNAAPDERVLFAYGMEPGSTGVPGSCDLHVSIAGPNLVGSAVADASGLARLDVLVPNAASGRTLFFQAVQRKACTGSNLVRFTFP